MSKNLILGILMWLAALSDELTTIIGLSLGAYETNPLYPYSFIIKLIICTVFSYILLSNKLSTLSKLNKILLKIPAIWGILSWFYCSWHNLSVIMHLLGVYRQ